MTQNQTECFTFAIKASKRFSLNPKKIRFTPPIERKYGQTALRMIAETEEMEWR